MQAQPDPCAGPVTPAAGPARGYRVVDFAALGGVRPALQKIAHGMLGLDRQIFPKHLCGADTRGGLAAVLEAEPHSWRAILAPNGDLAAYWHIAGLDPDRLQALKSGAAADGDLQAADYRSFSAPGVYDVYFLSACIAPVHDGIAARFAIIDSFLDNLDRLSRKGVFFDELLCTACTSAGEQLCAGLQLTPVPQAPAGIRSGRIGEILAHFAPTSFLRRYPLMQARYAAAGLA